MLARRVSAKHRLLVLALLVLAGCSSGATGAVSGESNELLNESIETLEIAEPLVVTSGFACADNLLLDVAEVPDVQVWAHWPGFSAGQVYDDWLRAFENGSEVRKEFTFDVVRRSDVPQGEGCDALGPLEARLMRLSAMPGILTVDEEQTATLCLEPTSGEPTGIELASSCFTVDELGVVIDD